ncbi:MAG: PSD1 and planctomycete cytochrome C domain-containing protein [Planctomycetaceae bacterium]
MRGRFFIIPGRIVSECLTACLWIVLPCLSLLADEPQPLKAPSTPAVAPPTSEQLQFVRTKVLPLLEARCFECHKNGKAPKGGLRLTGREAMLRGGDSGAAIVPGRPDESLLIQAVRYEGFEMPPRTRMPAQEVDILIRWIADGAVWPADLTADTAAADSHFPLQARRESHWAWQLITDPPVPAVTATEGHFNAVDAFVLHRLQAEGLTQASTADRHTLIRRLYFDIIGLPPSIAQVEAFVTDSRPVEIAMTDVVDELLASPHFGERWGRHWLDLVRYADTLGHEFDYPLHNAWQYRDYVIRAFNEDVPYDDFVREHVAGDLLPKPRRHPVEQFNESVIGTGFWFLCEDKHAPVDVRAEEAAKIDNQIDVFSKTFLGMTVACARCHDHKFDAITTTDYYALAGFLQSSRRQTAWLDPRRKIQSQVEALTEIRQQASDLIRNHSVPKDTAALQTYALAAAAAIPSDDAGRTAIAHDHGCVPELLTKWVDVLKQPATRLPEHPLSLLATITQTSADVTLDSAVAAWQTDITTARAQLSLPDSDTTRFADLTHGLPDGWFTTGDAFASPVLNNHLNLQLSESGVRMAPHDSVTTAALAGQLRGTLSSPTFELTAPEILVKVAGEKTRVRLVIDGYLMYEFSELLFKGARQAIDTQGEAQWLRLAGDVHRYLGHKAHLEFLDEGHGWFRVLEVRFAEKPGATVRQPVVSALNSELAASDELSQIRQPEQLVKLWLNVASRHANEATAALFNQHLLPGLHDNPQWADVVSSWQTLAKATPDPMPVIAMTEGSPENEHVFIRGNPGNLGPVAQRNILTALRTDDTSDEPISRRSSGRLELAQQLVSQDNPLVARVAVNRIWHHVFGAGIVESTDNFGVLGKQPSHPELLDYLATEFRRSGWSIKSLIRTLVLSRTYRSSSQASALAKERDPTNRWLHSANVRRLSGEAVRDAILLVSGRLDRTPFGPPVPVHLTAFMQGRGRPGTNGPLDGNGRRSLYLSVNRNFLSPFMQAFDVPAPVTTIGTRTTSNVPAQALILLNNEFVNQQARQWAQRLSDHSGAAAQEILKQAWSELFSRPASPEELQLLQHYIAESSAEDTASAADNVSLETLTQLCHILLNSKEFLFLR